eukprot:2675500-Amphidinium_carterae.1
MLMEQHHGAKVLTQSLADKATIRATTSHPASEFRFCELQSMAFHTPNNLCIVNSTLYDQRNCYALAV